MPLIISVEYTRLVRSRARLVLFNLSHGAQRSLLDVSSGGDPLRLAPHGHDHRGSYWRTAGRLPAQQEDPVHYKRPEDHELWRLGCGVILLVLT